jgi:hypothetical protein
MSVQWDEEFKGYDDAKAFCKEQQRRENVIAAMRWSKTREAWVVDVDEEDVIGDAINRANKMREHVVHAGDRIVVVPPPVIMEDEAINLIPQSEDFDGAAWSSHATVTKIVRIDALELQRLQIRDRIWHSCPSASVPELMKACEEVIKVVQC